MDPLEGQSPAAAVAEPQLAAPVPVVQDGMETFDPNTHIKVPKSDLGDYDGRWAGVMGDAHKFKAAQASGRLDPAYDKIADLARQNNMTIDQVYEYITNDGSAGGQQQQYDVPGQQGAGQQPPQALTVDQYKQLRDQERAEEQTARQSEQENTQRAQAFSSETEDVTRMLRDEFKYTFSEDGLPDGSKATVAQQLFNSSLNQVMKDDIPDWMSGDERAQALSSIGSTPSTSAQRQKAKDVFKTLVDDFKNDAVAEFAQGQSRVPSNSLAAGGSGPVSKDPSQMSYEEKVAELKGAVIQATGKNLDGSPA